MKQADRLRSSAPNRPLVALGLMAALLGALLVSLEPAHANSTCDVPPAGLEAALGGGGASVILTWQASPCGPDTYAVYRRNMDQAGDRMQFYATVDGATLTHTDSKVQAGITYRYRVKSNNIGKRSDYAEALISRRDDPDIANAGGTSPVFQSGQATTLYLDEGRTGEFGDPFIVIDPDSPSRLFRLSNESDQGIFTVDQDAEHGQLSSAPLDYESNPGKVFTFTLGVRDTHLDLADEDTLDITVHLVNVDEPGTVSIAGDVTAGEELTASLESDLDGLPDPTNVTWQWSRAMHLLDTFTDISTATSASYTPTTAADTGSYLRATAFYTDLQGPNKSASSTTSEAFGATNSEPYFARNAIPLLLLENVTEPTDLRKKNAGQSFTAVNGDGDTLTYSISDFVMDSGDADSFTVNSGTGQLTTKQGATFDFETQDRYFLVLGVQDGKNTLSAPDPRIDDTMRLNIIIENEDELGSVTIHASNTNVLPVEFSFTVTDPDGILTASETWWYRGESVDGTFERIEVSDGQPYTGITYETTANDVGKYIRVRARYMDNQAPNKIRNAEATWPEPIGGIDTSLSSLSVSPKNIIGFDGDRTSYEVGVENSVTQATVSATTSDDEATADFAPPDADLNVEDHQVVLSEGRNVVTVTVTAEDGLTNEYKVSVNRGVTDLKGWQAGADLDGLIAAGNETPRGIWSDETTVWVADPEDDKLHAYNLSDGVRDDTRDITLDADNDDPQGIWSNETIIWVADPEDDKLYAYNLSDGMREVARDINTRPFGNHDMKGIWSDETIIWVADDHDHELYAYNLSDGMREVARDITLAAGNTDSSGISSDGTTMWVADRTDDKLRAYRLSDGRRDVGGDINTLAAAGNNDPQGMWSDETTMWVADGSEGKIYAYIMPLSGDASLSELSVSPKNIIGFDGDRRSYEVGVENSVTQATVTATASHDAAMVAFAPPDADDNVVGHQVDLSAGRNAVAVTVTAENGSTQDYTVSVNQGVTDSTGWQAGADLDGLIAAGNNDPRGIWSNETIIWVADPEDDKLYAYNLSDGLRDDIRDITLDADNDDPRGIWSDGTIIWVADESDQKLYAYNLSNGMRDDSGDITLATNNFYVRGIWSNGTIVWVVDDDAVDHHKLFAYNLSNGNRVANRDINTLQMVGNLAPDGVWSDKTTIWVTDRFDNKLYAYNLSDGTRDTSLDIETLGAAGNGYSSGIWSDGTTVWVADQTDDKLYAYLLPKPEDDSAGVSIEPTTLTIDEGSSDTYTVKLNTEPSADVTVTISGHSGTDVSLSDTELDFTPGNWDTAQTVTVTAEQDDDAAGESEVMLNHALTGASEYEAIAAAAVPSVSVKITEDDSAGVSIVPTTLTINEGASKTYTVALNTQPSADVTVTISGHSGTDVSLSDTELDFTPGNWDTAQTVTVTAGQDDDATADTDVTLTHAVSGAGEYAAVDATDVPRVVVKITENDTAGVSIEPTTLTIDEGASKTYTVVLDTQPTADVTVTISGHAGTDLTVDDTELDFTADNWNTAQTVTVTAGQDDDATADTDVTLTHAVTGASEYEAIADDDVPSVAVRINEDDSAGVAISESSLTIVEGGSDTYTVKLNTQPSDDVTVTISGHTGTDVSLSDTELDFTPGNWNTAQTVTVTAGQDDDATADTDVTLTHAVTGASEYAAIAAAAVPSVSVTITEDDSPGVAISRTTLTINEGGAETYTVALNTQPSDDVTVTISGHTGTDVSLSDTELDFTPGNWDTAQTVTVTAEHDDDATADTDVTLTHAVTGASEYAAIDAAAIPHVSVTITEDDSPGVAISRTTLTINEGGSDTYTVALNTQPSDDVTVTISGHTGTDVSLSDTELDFTPGNWDTAQTVTVTAEHDDDATADTDVTLTHAVTGASEYEAIADDDVPSVAVRINEDDSAGVAISESSLTIVEGGSDTYTVKLNTQPSADVTVTISGHAGTDVSLSDTELDFTPGNWDTAQTVTVTAGQDDDATADTDVTLTHAVTGASEYAAIAAAAVPSVSVTITEDDSPGVAISRTTLTINEGGAETYTVALNTQPSDDVTVTISGHTGTDVSLSDTELDFTPGNWDTAQTVTVTAEHDDDATADTDVTLTHAVTGASEYAAIAATDVPRVVVKITDDDRAGVSIVPTTLTITEGGSKTYTVVLDTEPSADVKVTISGHSGTDVSLSDTELDFTTVNWDTAQTVTVTAGQDDDATADTDVTLTHAVSGAGEYAAVDATDVPRVVVKITENDTAGVSIEPTTLTIDEGASKTYTVVLDTQPTADVTVTISGHAGTDLTVDDTELDFTAGNWDTAQTVTVTAGQDDDATADTDVTLTHAVTGASEYEAIADDDVPSVAVRINEDDSAGVAISESSLTIVEGGSDTYTVKLNTQPSADVTVTISGHAGTDVSLSDTELDFTPGNWDTAQTVTVTAGQDDDATADTDVTLTHAVTGASEYAAIAAAAVPSVSVTITEDDSPGVAISRTTLTINEGGAETYTVALNTQPSDDVTVTISGHTGTDVSLSDTELDFTPGNWDTAQTVTVTAEHDDDATADTDVTLTHAVTGASEYAAIDAAAIPHVSVTITEDDSAGVAISRTTLTINEGGSDTYTVALNTQPSDDVTVTISGHTGTDVSLSDTELDFTPGNWDTAQTVTVTAEHDDDATADTDVTLTHAVTGASEYAAIAAAAIPRVLVKITEDDSAGVAISESSLTIVEGGSDTYTVKLNTEPSAEVTVTISGHAGTDVSLSDTELDFTPGNWNTEQTVTVTAEHDDDATADTDVTLTHAVTGASEYAAIAADDVPSVVVKITENDTAGVSIEPTTLTITEGASKTYTVKLNTEPSADVTVTISGHTGTDVSLSDTELDFTTGNWGTAQTVTVTAGEDDDAAADTDVTLTHAVTGASEYAAIAAAAVPRVVVTITENDTPGVSEDDSAGVSIVPTTLTIDEGASKTYTVVLDTEPSADVTVTISGHTGTDVSLSGNTLSATNTLTFTTGDWETAQTVTVTAEHDDDIAAESDVTLAHALTGASEYAAIAAADIPVVEVTINENDSAGVSISKSKLNIDEGGSGIYKVALDSEPTVDVTVTISGHTGTDVSLSGDTLSAMNTLTFTAVNWYKAQTVTVTAGHDVDEEDDSGVTLSHAVTGASEYAAIATASIRRVSVTINDDDVQMTSSTIRDAADYLILGFVSQSSYEPSVHDPGLWARGHGNPVPLTIGENAIDQKDLPADGNLFTVECFDKDGRKTDCYEPGTSWGNELASNVVRVEWADIFPNSVVWVHDFPIAQKFRTGSAGPYLLAGLEVHVRDVDAGEEMQVLIARGNGSIGQQIDLLVEEEVSDVVKREVKQDGLYELRLDGALQNGSNTYVAPEGAILESETEYYLFFRATRERVTHVGPRAEVYIDSYPQNQAHRLSDWQIDDQVMTVGLDRSYPALSEDGKVLDYSYSLPSWTPQPGRLAAFPLGLVSGSERVQSLQAVPATSGITVSWTSHSLADRYLLQWRTSNQNWTDAISAGQEKDLSSVVQYQLTVADGHVVQGSTYRIRVLGVSNSFAELFEYSHTTGEVSVGASTQLEASPLTASVESAPEAHDGQSAFRVRIKFSDDLAITPEAMRDEALLVIGGQLTDASPVGGQQDLWELTIEPQGMGPVSIMTTLSGTCQLEGDLCTADGRPLTTGLALQVAGPTPLPTISGTAQVGETLTVDTSAIADFDGLSNAVYQYQWLANDADIAGATAKTYTLVDADEGAAIKVRVSFTDDAGNDETLTSAATAMVESAQPTGSAPDAPRKPNGTAVFIGGVDLEWDDVPGADTYQVQTWRGGQWTDLPGDGVEIAFYGAGAIVSGLDPQSSLWFQVRAANAHGVSDWSPMLLMNATSEFTLGRRARTANVTATGAPVIMGAAEVGETLRVDTMGIEDGNGLDQVQFEYQWTSNDGGGDVDIAGATQPTYVWSDDEEGGTVSVRVSFVDRLGYAESLSSAAVGAVVAQQQTANSPATGQPTISGTAQVGATLTADTSGISDADGLTNASYSYQWLSDDMDIAGATATTYTLTDADEGAAIKVQVSFTDDAGNDESLTSAATGTVETRPNSPATGQPAISGTAQVGETLNADTSGIADQDGLNNVAYSYQWLADDADIAGATATTYTLTDSEEGKALQVRVSFTDDAGNEEELTSAATGTVEARPNSPATGQPTIAGTVQVGETLTADTSGISDDDGLNQASYSYQWLADDADIAGATVGTYTLVDADEGAAIKVRVSFTDDAGNEEELTSAATGTVEARPNSPATGQPTIAGTVQVGETLTADTSGISDDDGLNQASYSYQWLADDADIAGATVGTYTLVDADEGAGIKVRVSFTDDAGHEETLTSAATVSVAAAESAEPPAPPTGLTAAPSHDQVVLSWDDPQDDSITGYVILRRNRATTAPGEFTELVADTGSAATTYTDDSVSADTSYTYKIRTINEHGVSELSRWARADTPAPSPANSPATGAPTIAGTAQVGETLTADTSGIVDQDGLTNVAYDYQWLADDADIAGATDSSYTPTDGDEGTIIKLRVSFTDDAGNEETMTSAATEPVGFAVQQQIVNTPATGQPTISGMAQVGETLTADTSGISDVDGLSSVSYSYQWLADDADIAGATDSSYTPTDGDEGAIIKLRVSFTDDAGNEETMTSAATEPVGFAVQQQIVNTPATGQPTISGMAQVGETLTADTSGISDVDGLSSVSYSYQWLADDAAITGATATTYTLTDSEQGRTVKVRVSFTDDAGNDESLTSAATGTVEARPNSPATGAPVIVGTAQVGETLTADTSGIADADGLSSAVYHYQWIVSDGGADLVVPGAKASTYTVLAIDRMLVIKVRVHVTDDRGHVETRTSAPTAVVR